MRTSQKTISTYTLNWSVNWLLIFGYSLWVLQSCKKPEDPNLRLPAPGDDLSLQLIDSLKIEVETVLALDTFNTNNPNSLLSGIFIDTDLGKTTAICFTELTTTRNLPFSGSRPSASRLDSTTVLLQYDYVYGDTLDSLTYNVYRLDEQIEGNYNNRGSIPYNSNKPIATFTFKPSASNKFIRFRADSLGAEIISLQDDQMLIPNDFRDSFRGLALVPDPANRCMIGFIPTFESTRPFNSIRVYYRQSDTSTANVSELFSINQECDKFNRISVDRSGTPLASLNTEYDFVPPSQTGGSVFLQNGTGTRVRFRIPELSTLTQKYGNLAIARLDIEITPDPPGLLSPPGSYLVYLTDEAGKIKVVNEVRQQVISDESTILFPIYNSTENKIVLRMSVFAQLVINGDISNDGYILATSLFLDKNQVNKLKFREDQIKAYLYVLKLDQIQ